VATLLTEKKHYEICKNIILKIIEFRTRCRRRMRPRRLWRPVINFTNVLQTAFTRADPKSAKKDTDDSTVFFVPLGSALGSCKSLRKLEPFSFCGFSDLRNPQNAKLCQFWEGCKTRFPKLKPDFASFWIHFASFWTSKLGFGFRNWVSKPS